MRELTKLGVSFDVRYGMHCHLLRQAIFFADPAGNHYAVYAPEGVPLSIPPTHSAKSPGVGYIELEAPDVDASIKFYHDVLGFRGAKPQR